MSSVPSREQEKLLYHAGKRFIVGVDEAGRGPLAGPVVAASCSMPLQLEIEGVRDSKLLSPLQRSRLFEKLISHPQLSFGIGVVSAAEIDQLNIYRATMRAIELSVRALRRLPDHLFIDGNPLPQFFMEHQAIVGGDRLCYLVAAASILAKEWRDRLMVELDLEWPQYGFRQHKGYPTAAHRAALLEWGPCPHHRRTFEPIKSYLASSSASLACR